MGLPNARNLYTSYLFTQLYCFHCLQRDFSSCRVLIVKLVIMGDSLGDEWWKLEGSMSDGYYFFTTDVDSTRGRV